MPGSAFDPSGFGRRAAAIAAGTVLAAGAAGVGWWQTHLSTSPSCQITAPAAGTVSGTVAIAATCGASATAVSFYSSGVFITSDATFPYTASWDSTLVVDGSYSLTAVSTDATGSTTTSAAVSVTTSNGNTGGGTAKLWISAAGDDPTCAPNASAVSYAVALAASPKNVCATGTKAYQVASLGTTVLVQGAPFTVTSQWNFTSAMKKTVTSGTCNYNYGGTSDFSQCVTIKPAPGQSLVFAVPGTGIVKNAQVFDCVSGLSIQNATWDQTTYTDNNGHVVSTTSISVGIGDATCGSSSFPHDVYLANNNYGGQLNTGQNAGNIWVVGGAATSTKELVWQFANPTTSGIVGVNFQGYNFVDTGFYHMECVHVNGGDNHQTYAANRFNQCPIESLFFETNSNAMDNVLIENNDFDAGSGGGPFKISCRSAGCSVTNNTIRFNTFKGAWANACEPTTGTCTYSNNNVYGNLGNVCTNTTTNGGTISGTPLTDGGYNVNATAASGFCSAGTNSYSATITYVSGGSPNYDLHLSGAQTATNFVPNSVTWPPSGTYRDGTARSGATTDAGAN